MNLETLQAESHEWRKKNFGDYTDADQFEGVVEELGELAKARLKRRQMIRGGEQFWIDQERDAVADITIFLAGYCQARGFSYAKTVDRVWTEVKQRDWVANPVDGKANEPHPEQVFLDQMLDSEV